MGKYAEFGSRFARLRRKQRPKITQQDAAGLLGCSKRTVTNIEAGVAVSREHYLAAVRLADTWDMVDQSAKTVYETARAPYTNGVVPLDKLTDPEAVVIGALQNGLLLMRDRDVPLPSRLTHLRLHLEFLIANFLGEASLPRELEQE